MSDRDALARADRVEALLAELEELPDGPARALATEAVGALVDLYGEALARMTARTPSDELVALCDDELVSHLLMVHDLHPSTTEERVAAALATVRPYLESHGGGVELLGLEGGVARLRLEGSCSGCPSSRVTLESAVEEAILRHAPEIESVEAQDAPDATGPPPLLQIESCPAEGVGGRAA